MSLRSVNLNLIPILQALLRHQNVSRAADALSLSQPTVSAALTRLRDVLNDPLLLQIGRKMELTPRARQLIGPVEEACAAMQVVLKPIEFEARNAARTFSIASVDHMAGLVGPPLVEILARVAPSISVHFINAAREVRHQLRLGEVDLMILPRTVITLLTFPEIRIAPLFFEQFVSVVGPSHALANQPNADEATLAAHPHVIFSPGFSLPDGFGDPYGMPAATLANAVGVNTIGQPRITARFEHLGALPLMAALSHSVAIMPRLLALQMQPFLDLRLIGRPLPPIEVCLAWSPLLESDPAHRWFRALLIETIGDHARSNTAAKP